MSTKLKWILILILYCMVMLAGLTGAAYWIAYQLGFHPDLGGLVIGNYIIYFPWAFFIWSHRYGNMFPQLFGQAHAILIGAFIAASLLMALIRPKLPLSVQPVGRDKWATRKDLDAAGLLTGYGTVVGLWPGRRGGAVLTYNGPEHQMVSGASRSGKGVGHVIPTLLNWPGSLLAYDVKGELWQTTAGFRATFSRCLAFNPTNAASVRFNPLFEIRHGPEEVRDTQNLVEMLVNPTGSKASLDIWDQQASQLLVALVLHVLYTEPPERKNLAVVRARLLDFERTCLAMSNTNHRKNPETGDMEPHPEIHLVAQELLSQPDKFQASVRGTAAAYLTLWADERVAHNTSASDFRLGDLMCSQQPVSLYLQPPPSDAARLRPLVRLVINQTCRALMENLKHDNAGRVKRHRLLLMLDEFPTLGRLDFFTTNLRQMAGYGIKSHLIVQSFNDIVEAYGPHNTLIDNCHVLVTFASADTTTCQRVSQMTGTVTEYRESYSQPRKGLWSSAPTISQSEQVRPLLSLGDIRELPGDEQLIFVTGHKPIRTRKLKYFSHPGFVPRLRPAPTHSDTKPAEAIPIRWTAAVPAAAPPSQSSTTATPNRADGDPPTVNGSNSTEPPHDVMDV